MAVDVSKHVAKADNAYQQRKYDLAIEIYLQALQIDPDNRNARRGVRLAALKKHEHNYPSAFSIKIATAGSRMAMMNPNAEAKMAACESYLKADPRNVKVAYTLGETAEKAGYVNAAIGVYEAMVSHAPKEVDAFVHLGRLLGPTDPDNAIKHLESALNVNPKNQQALKLRKDLAAELSIKRTGFETAQHTHDLLRDSEGTKEMLKAERIHKSSDEAGDLVTRLEKTIERNPDDRHAKGRLAKAYSAAGRYDDAMDIYRGILDGNPGDFDAREQLGDIRISLAEKDVLAAEQAGDEAKVAEAKIRRRDVLIEEYQARVAEHPTDLALRFQLGKALLAADELDGAIAEFQKSVKDPRKRFESLGALGDCFLRKELYDLAARQLEKALAESPGMSSEQGKDVVYNLGLLRERQGDLAAAKEHYLSVYEVDLSFRDVADKVTQLSK